jgi:hypothetical protein
MALRNPTFIRWTEKAEASHVLDWAGFEPDSASAAAVCTKKPNGLPP